MKNSNEQLILIAGVVILLLVVIGLYLFVTGSETITEQLAPMQS